MLMSNRKLYTNYANFYEQIVTNMLVSWEHYKQCYYIHKVNIQATLPCFTYSNPNDQISEILLQTMFTSTKQ